MSIFFSPFPILRICYYLVRDFVDDLTCIFFEISVTLIISSWETMLIVVNIVWRLLLFSLH